MEEVLKQVKHKGKVVGEVLCPLYTTVDEILEAENAERIVAVFNNGNHVRIMGNERAKHSGVRTGKKKRTEMAFSCLTIDEMTSCATDGRPDPAKLQTLLDSPEVQARVDAKIAEEGPVDEVETEEEVE